MNITLTLISPRTTPDVAGCRHCDIGLSVHGVRWTANAGAHAWAPPTIEQILDRVRDYSPWLAG